LILAKACRVAGEFADDPLVQNIVAFVRAGGKRPLMRPNVARRRGQRRRCILTCSATATMAARKMPLAIDVGPKS
jgi:hypothetical protein